MHQLLDWLISVDRQLFFILNLRFSNDLFDFLMPLLTDPRTWYLPMILVVVYLIYNYKKRGLLIVLLLIIGVLLADVLTVEVLKPLIGRLRPCKSLEGFRLLVHCGGRFGFPSTHAANAAVIGSVLIFSIRKWIVPISILVILVGYTRIYVGVHYPLDVLGGFVSGGALGYLLSYLHHKFLPNKFRYSK